MKRFFLLLFCGLMCAAMGANAQTPTQQTLMEDISRYGPVVGTLNSGTSISGNLHQDGTFVVFPNSLTVIPVNYCQGGNSITPIPPNTGLKTEVNIITIVVKEGITVINNNVFQQLQSLTTIYFPTSITSIGANVLFNCDELKNMIIYNPNPPDLNISSNTFSNQDGFELIVPENAIQNYTEHKDWGQFTSRTVKFDLNGSTIGSINSYTGVRLDSTIPNPPDPTHHSGYAFGGWFRETDCINEWNFDRDLVRGNLTLYAKWIIPVTDVSLNKTSTTIPMGETESLTATVSPSNATNKNVTWSSNNTAVATVNATTGVITAVGVGEATITATAADGSGKTATCDVEVIPGVTGVTISPHSITMNRGKTYRFTATVSQQGCPSADVTWTVTDGSGNPLSSGTTIGNDGTLDVASGELEEELIIVATSVCNTSKTGEATVTLTDDILAAEVLDVTINPTTVIVYKGEMQQFIANVTVAGDASSEITWSVTDNLSQDTEIDQDGKLIVAVDETAATLTVIATSTEDITQWAEATVTVKDRPEVVSVTVVPDKITLDLGVMQQFVTIVDTKGDLVSTDVTWTVEPSYYSSIDYTGLLKVGDGERAPALTVTATSVYDDTKKGTAIVTLFIIPVTDVTLNKTVLELAVGGAEQLIATVVPSYATNPDISWSSDQPGIATVDATGLVVGVSEGTATITVETDDGNFTANCIVTVMEELTGTATIDNMSPRIGDELTGSLVSGNSTTLTYVWKADGIQVGTGINYIVDVADLGKVITLEISSTARSGTLTSNPTAAVLKRAAPAAPEPPTLEEKTHNSVTLTAITGNEYSMDGTTWTSDNLFEGLESNTAYTFYQRIAETAESEKSASSAALNVTTHPPALTGTATIDNMEPRIGDMLTGSLVSSNNTGTLSYVWKVAGLLAGTGEYYTVTTADLGKVITLEITSSVETGTITSEATAAVKKGAAPPAPEPPTFVSVTHNSVRLTRVTGYEYSLDGATWQGSTVFGNLNSETPYNFYQRIAETDDREASAASAALNVITDVTPPNALEGTAVINNMEPRIGDVLIGSFEGDCEGELSYIWYIDDIEAGTGLNYTVTLADLGKEIILEISSSEESGTVTSEATARVLKRLSDTPPAPTLASKTHNSVTLVKVEGYEYSIDGVTWQDEPTFEGLEPETAYIFYQRAAETNEAEVSAASAALNEATLEEPKNTLSGTATIDHMSPRIGDTLTGSLVDGNNTGTLTYVWKVDGESVGTGENFIVTVACLGKVITLEITSSVETGTVTSDPTNAVLKREAIEVRDAPNLMEKTDHSVTLVQIAGYEYSMDGSNWQSDNVFEGLEPETEYTFYQRLAETDETLPSPTSPALLVTTDMTPSIIETLLDFDTYVITKWNNTFMLNIRKLTDDGYIVTHCEWFKTTSTNVTDLGTGLIYSVGPQRTDVLEAGATYYFVISTGNRGELRSTNKVIGSQHGAVMLAYPNPVQAGNTLTIEGVTEGSPIQVYNPIGVCVSHTIATGSPVTLTLQVPAGLYVIRTNNGEIKIVITN